MFSINKKNLAYTTRAADRYLAASSFVHPATPFMARYSKTPGHCQRRPSKVDWIRDRYSQPRSYRHRVPLRTAGSLSGPRIACAHLFQRQCLGFNSTSTLCLLSPSPAPPTRDGRDKRRGRKKKKKKITRKKNQISKKKTNMTMSNSFDKGEKI